MNDTEKPTLRKANDNPWYCLATLYGEQVAGKPGSTLAQKNCAAWNRWFADTATEDEREQIRETFANRAGGKCPPEPDEIANFSDTQFDRRIDFKQFVFRARADFRHATFLASVDFTQAQFQNGVNFGACTFESVALFNSATIKREAGFEATTFSRNVYFIGATFSGHTTFKSATFAAPTFFGRATFFELTTFSSATFRDFVSFDSVKFSGWTFFNSACFNGFVRFGEARFSSRAEFKGASFISSIDFINAKFDMGADFADVRFEGDVPDFRGATMHEATEWHGVAWPKPPTSKNDAQRQVYLYERLKKEMETLKKHEAEQFFFRMELRTRRGLYKILSSAWLLNVIYEASSGYGLSVRRPILCLTGVFVAGIAIFTQAPLCAGQPMPLRPAIRLSFANIFVFLNDKRELMAMPEMSACLSNTTAAVSAVQSISGVVLLFLLGLALRNRFRMK